jgi:hypothetical protein
MDFLQKNVERLRSQGRLPNSSTNPIFMTQPRATGNISTSASTTPFTYYRSIRRELPEQKEMTYQEAGIPETSSVPQDQAKRIARRDIVLSAPEQRRQYYRDIETYNVQLQSERDRIKQAQRDIDEYNRKVREYNKKRTYYERVPVSGFTIERTIKEVEKPKDFSDFFRTIKERQEKAKFDSEFVGPIKPTTSKVVWKDNTAKISNLIGSYRPTEFTPVGRTTANIPSIFRPTEFKIGEFGVGSDKEVPKQNIKLLFTDPGLYKKRMDIKIESITKDRPAISIEKFQAFALGFYGSTIVSSAQLGSALGRDPVGTVKGIPKGFLDAWNPATIVKSFTTEPYSATGQLSGRLFSAYAMGYTGKQIGSAFKTAKYEIFGKEIPAEAIFDKKVLSGKAQFPTVKTSKEVVTAFKKTKSQQIFPELKGKQVGISTTQYPFKIKTVKTKAQLGQPLTEDPGQFFSALGRGSPKFTGITKSQKIKFSINPFGSSGKPAGYVAGFERVAYLPKFITRKPGFTAVEKYTTSKAGTGTAFITKRGQIGKGEIKPQSYYLGGKKLFEKGTTEIEVVKAPTTKYSFVGKKIYYTRYLGQIVPLRVVIPKRTAGQSLLDSLITIPGKKISDASSSFDKYFSDYVSNVKYVKPSVVPVAYYGSSRTSTPTSKMSSYFSSTTPTRSMISKFSISDFTRSYKSTPITKSNISLITKSVSKPITSIFTTKQITKPITSITKLYSTSTFDRYFKPIFKITYTPKSTARPTLPNPFPTPPTMNRRITSKPKTEKREEFEPAYNTFVKQKGNWLKVNKPGELNCINTATDLGIRVTDNTSARSFKVSKAPGTAKTKTFLKPNLYKFYKPGKSAKLTGAWIEKSKHLIDTPGEIQGISAKGWITNRNRRKGK